MNKGLHRSTRARDDFDPMTVAMQEAGVSGGRPSNAGNRKKSYPKHTEKSSNLPPASERSTSVAAAWIQASAEYGFEVPYNDVWLAHQISAKVVSDPMFVPWLENGDHQKVKRMLDKMTELFWKYYVDDEVTAKNVRSVYLDEVWSDLRDFAHTSLRASWLKQHGVRVPRPTYDPAAEQEMHREIQGVKIREYLEKAAAESEPPPFKKLDTHHREVLRSLMDHQGEDDE